MLEVVLYQSNQDLFEQLSADTNRQIICPSPSVADNLRLSLPHSDIITISKWVSNHLKNLKESKSRKSDLMLNLAAVWRHYFPAGKAAHFREAFDLFTELRSFTLELELLSEFFKELEEDMVKSILIFWTYLIQEKIVDEHLSYQKITESNHLIPLAFVGFKHMSGVQIDMLRRLSETQEVLLLFPRPVFDESLSNDWIKWLEPNISMPDSGKLHNKYLKVMVPVKGKVNELLSAFVLENDHDLVLATTTPKFLHFQEIHQNHSFLKSSDDLFSGAIDEVVQKLKLICEAQNFSIKASELILKLDNYKKAAVMSGDYRLYKSIELTVTSIEQYSLLQEKIDNFAIEIIAETVMLNAPRTSVVSLEKTIDRSIADINALNFRSSFKPLAVIATNGVNNFRSNEKILSENMTKALRVIGPIKRAGLDYLFYKKDLIETLSHPDSVLIIEQELLDSDLSWKEILKFFEIDFRSAFIKKDAKALFDFIGNKMKKGPFVKSSFSATSLQTYIDCPRKYYFSYIHKLDNRPEVKNNLSADELGKLEHAVIAAYFEKVSSLNIIDRTLHRDLCWQMFSKLLIDKNMDLNKSESSKSFHEVLHYSLNGILFLADFAEINNVLQYKFEIPLSDNRWSLKGSIDCIAVLPMSKIAVFDFKRSAAATGTKSETVEFKKIQLWVYLLTLIEKKEIVSAFGYVNLSDLADDKLLFTSDEASEIVTNSIERLQQYIEKIIFELNSRTDFEPLPRDNKVCTYCPVTLFCHKGSLT